MTFNYFVMVQDALRGVFREALRHVASHGLPGDHHFYITFRTRFQGVDIPLHMEKRYPSEMTIVLQNQFWNLEVREREFEVSLSFNNHRQRLVIPFEAVTAFSDPSVDFRLHFEIAETSPDTETWEKPEITLDDKGQDQVEIVTEAEVVSLDQFRKKT